MSRHMRHSSWRPHAALIALLTSLLVVSAGRAQNAGQSPPRAEGPAEHSGAKVPASPTATGPTIGVRAGYAFFGRGRSYAVEHRLKPALGVDALWPLADDWKLGVAANGVVTADSNYGVWSVTARLAFSLIATQRFQLWAVLGAGAGYNAPILHGDLEAGFPVIGYAALAVEPTFHLGDRWDLGVAVEVEQLSVIHLAPHLAYLLP